MQLLVKIQCNSVMNLKKFKVDYAIKKGKYLAIRRSFLNLTLMKALTFILLIHLKIQVIWCNAIVPVYFTNRIISHKVQARIRIYHRFQNRKRKIMFPEIQINLELVIRNTAKYSPEVPIMGQKYICAKNSQKV